MFYLSLYLTRNHYPTLCGRDARIKNIAIDLPRDSVPSSLYGVYSCHRGGPLSSNFNIKSNYLRYPAGGSRALLYERGEVRKLLQHDHPRHGQGRHNAQHNQRELPAAQESDREARDEHTGVFNHLPQLPSARRVGRGVIVMEGERRGGGTEGAKFIY